MKLPFESRKGYGDKVCKTILVKHRRIVVVLVFLSRSLLLRGYSMFFEKFLVLYEKFRKMVRIWYFLEVTERHITDLEVQGDFSLQ